MTITWLAKIKDAQGFYRFQTELRPMPLDYAVELVKRSTEDSEYTTDYPMSIEVILKEE